MILHRFDQGTMEVAGYLLLERAYRHVDSEDAWKLILERKKTLDFASTKEVCCLELSWLLGLTTYFGNVFIAEGSGQ